MTLRHTVRKIRTDPRTRSTVIQWIVITVVLAAIGIAVHNLSTNLAIIGKDFDFSFLLTPASYDISFSPFVDYSSRDTHLMAAVVGLLNTALIAVTGIATATVLGFIAPEDGSKDAFVHISAVERAGLGTLQEGQRLSYELRPGRNGKFAADDLAPAG